MEENKHHDLKVWSEFFPDIELGNKPFEVRKDDRNFQVGDILHLHDYDPDEDSYSGNMCHRVITYKLEGGQFGVEKGYCVLGITRPTKQQRQ